jgi:hypothetical protein
MRKEKEERMKTKLKKKARKKIQSKQWVEERERLISKSSEYTET